MENIESVEDLFDELSDDEELYERTRHLVGTISLGTERTTPKDVYLVVMSCGNLQACVSIIEEYDSNEDYESIEEVLEDNNIEPFKE